MTLNTKFILIGTLLLMACNHHPISGLQESKEKCLFYGFKPGHENFSRCILIEEMRMVGKNPKNKSNENNTALYK